ncbi:MAG: choice-of-anchor D domain-containing protein [Phycisphaerae bacterium]|nr:choice-of-anchor D domain-containing protein [Phycisphaerae bacterium]
MLSKNSFISKRHFAMVLLAFLVLFGTLNAEITETQGDWVELGWRSASSGGVSWNLSNNAAESTMVLGHDGDPIVFWVEGPGQNAGDKGVNKTPINQYATCITEFVQPLYYEHSYGFEVYGIVNARQHCGDLGWWDLRTGLGDGNGLNILGTQLDAAVKPNGDIVLCMKANGSVAQVYLWNGSNLEDLGIASEGVIDRPKVAVGPTGEIFVCYTAIPWDAQGNLDFEHTEVVVRKYTYNYTVDSVGGPSDADLAWVELRNADIEDFTVEWSGGVSNSAGVSFDPAIAIDVDGLPVVVWTEVVRQGNVEVFGKKWDGRNWNEIGLGSTSDPDGDSNFGISSDPTQSLQPDIAITETGNYIVTWVNFGDWANNYWSNPQAAVYVKTLFVNSQVWEEYSAGSATGSGIVPEGDTLGDLADGELGLGWYYVPEITLDKDGYPLITFVGFCMPERFAHDLDNDMVPDFPDLSFYCIKYDGAGFNMIYDNRRGSASATVGSSWSPSAIINDNDELIIAYAEGTRLFSNEIFVQKWDAVEETWIEHGRGSMSFGNDFVGGYPFGEYPVVIGDHFRYNPMFDPEFFMESKSQIAMVDYSNDPTGKMDVLLAIPGTLYEYMVADDPIPNAGKMYVYRRDTGKWSDELQIDFGRTFDLVNSPENSFEIEGSALLAYLDDEDGLPYVYEFRNGAWNLLGGGAASADAGNTEIAGTGIATGISAQVGPNGQILLAYLASADADTDVVKTRLWDPGSSSWIDAGDGELPNAGALNVAYYDHFDMHNFGLLDEDADFARADDVGSITAGAINAQTGAEVHPFYRWGNWVQWRRGSLIEELIGDLAGAAIVGPDGANPPWGPGRYNESLITIEKVEGGDDTQGPGMIGNGWGADQALKVSFEIPGTAAGPGHNIAVSDGAVLAARITRGFKMAAEDHVMVEMCYAFDTDDFFTANGEPEEDGTVVVNKRPLITGNLYIYGLIDEVDGDVTTAKWLDGDPSTPIDFLDDNGDLYDFPYPGLEPIDWWPAFHDSYYYHRKTLDTSEMGMGKLGIGDHTLTFIPALIMERTEDEPTKVDGLVDFLASVGAVTITEYLEGRDADPDVDGDADVAAHEQRASIAFDNIAVYQRVVKTDIDNSNGAPDESFFDEATDFDNVDPLVVTDWEDDGGDGVAVYDAAEGNDDNGSVKISLTDGDINESLVHTISKTITVPDGHNYVEVEMAVRVLMTGLGTRDVVQVAVAEDVYLQGLVGAAVQPGTLVDGNYEYLEFSGIDAGTNIDTDWLEVKLNRVFELAPGDHKMDILVSLMDVDFVDDDGTVDVWVDDIKFNFYPGVTTYEAMPYGSDANLNNHVGGSTNLTTGRPDYGKNRRECYRIHVEHDVAQPAAIQSLKIAEVVQGGKGPMAVGFRYRLDSDNGMADGLSGIKVRIGDRAYNVAGEDDFLTLPDWWGGTGLFWSNSEITSPPFPLAYAYFVINPEVVDAGTYDVSIELTLDGGGFADLWIDDIFVASTKKGSPEKILATLSAVTETGTGQTRRFAIGGTYRADDFWCHDDGYRTSLDQENPQDDEFHQTDGRPDENNDGIAGGDTTSDPYPDGYLRSLSPYVGDEHRSVCIYELIDNEWQLYGDRIVETIDVDFLGIRVAGSYFPMPRPELQAIAGITIDKSQWLWTATQHYTSVWSPDPLNGNPFRYAVHPYQLTPPALTELNLEIFGWEPVGEIDQLGWVPHWVNKGFEPAGHNVGANTRYQFIDMATTHENKFVLGWTEYDDWTGFTDVKFNYMPDIADNLDNTDFGRLYSGNEELQDARWDPTLLSDIEIKPGGSPIVSFWMSEMLLHGIREFVEYSDMPFMQVEDASGNATNNVLELGDSVNEITYATFVISNKYPTQVPPLDDTELGQLVIYGIEFGGFGQLDGSQFDIIGSPTFPIRLDGGERHTFTVRFDSNGVPAGQYDGALVIHSNSVVHPTHPFGQFYELNISAMVLNRGIVDMSVNSQYVEFEEKHVIGNIPAADDPAREVKQVLVRNIGTEDLTIFEWLFSGTGFEVQSAYVGVKTNNSVIYGAALASTKNIVGTADDVVLTPGDYLKLNIIFSPTESRDYNDTLFIHSSDPGNPYMASRLKGLAYTGADMEITVDDGNTSYGIDLWEPEIDLGSVVKGESKTVTVNINNVGTSLLTLSDVRNLIPIDEVTFDPDNMENIEIDPGQSFSFDMTFSPAPNHDPDDNLVIEMESLVLVANDVEDTDLRFLKINVLALAVPKIPVIRIIDPATNEEMTSLDFGIVNAEQSVDKSFLIKNIGGKTATITGWRFSRGTGAYTFSPINPVGVNPDAGIDEDPVLLPNESVLVSITFLWANAGIIRENVIVDYKPGDKFEDGDMSNTPTVLILRAEVTDRELAVTDTQGESSDNLINFGKVGQGQSAGQNYYITLSNLALSPVTVTGWSYTGDAGINVMPFSNEVVLAYGETYMIEVGFAPETLGLINGAVRIVSNSPTATEQSPWLITIRGEGVFPGQVSFAPAALDFGQVPLGDSSTETLVLTNTGNANIYVKDIVSESTYFKVSTLAITDANGYYVVPAGNSISFDVKFVASNPFDATVNLSVVTDNISDGAVNNLIPMTAQTKTVIIGDNLTVNDGSGHTLKIVVKGGGFATVETVSATNNDIASIALVGTTMKSSVYISGPGVESHVGQIIGGTIKNLVLKKITLDGDIDNDGVQDSANTIEFGHIDGTITLGDVVDGADINILSVNAKGTTIKAGSIGYGTDMTINGNIKTLSCDEFGDGMIEASSLKSFKVGKGDCLASLNVAGDVGTVSIGGGRVDGDYIIGGEIKTFNAKKAVFTGIIKAEEIGSVSCYNLGSDDASAMIATGGSIKKVSVGKNVQDSHILAGFDLGANNVLGGGDDSLRSGGIVKSVSVKGSFQNSYVMAGLMTNAAGNFDVFGNNPPMDSRTGEVGKVKLGYVIIDNAGVGFGIGSHSKLGSAKAGRDKLSAGDKLGDFSVGLY